MQRKQISLLQKERNSVGDQFLRQNSFEKRREFCKRVDQSECETDEVFVQVRLGYFRGVGTSESGRGPRPAGNKAK